MATYTPNIGLQQWAATDNFLRTDFNTDLSKIDTALGSIRGSAEERPELVTGSYIGDATDDRVISLGFQPKALWVKNRDDCSVDYHTNQISYVTNMAIPGQVGNILKITGQGFQINHFSWVNNNTSTFIYVALR